MKNVFKNYFIVALIALLLPGCSSIIMKLDANNYTATDMVMKVESLNRKSVTKTSTSFTCQGVSNDQDKFKLTTESIKAYKNGVVKLKYSPSNSSAKFNLEEISVHSSNDTMKETVDLPHVNTYNEEDEKEKLEKIAKTLDLKNTKKFKREVDISKQLGALIIGKFETKKLTISDYYYLVNEDIEYDEPIEISGSAMTSKDIMAAVEVSVPIYGSLSSNFENNDLHLVTWSIKHYNYASSFNAARSINELEDDEKQVLINSLNLFNQKDSIYILREFSTIESAAFSTSKSTKIETSAEAAVASVFTGSGGYTFKSDDSELTSTPGQSYNLKYVALSSVEDMIENLSEKEELSTTDKGAFYPDVIIDESKE